MAKLGVMPDETARLAWVRGLTRASPDHASWQTRQRQFHCGNPPPAAAPSTMAVGCPIQARRQKRRRGSELGRQIAVDLEADANLDKRWSGPGRPVHGRFLSLVLESAVS